MHMMRPKTKRMQTTTMKAEECREPPEELPRRMFSKDGALFHPIIALDGAHIRTSDGPKFRPATALTEAIHQLSNSSA
jgi:hypothetical protein